MGGDTYQKAAAALDEDTREFLSDDEGEEFSYPEFVEDWGNVVVVDNLPKIPMGKYDKLLGVLKRIFAQTGAISNLEMPNENDMTARTSPPAPARSSSPRRRPRKPFG